MVNIHQGNAYVLHINTYRDRLHMSLGGIPGAKAMVKAT